MTQNQFALGREVPCPVCGYDLRAAAAGGRCPECGTQIEGRLAASRMPWVHRRYRGRIKSYVKTVWMVCFRPERVAEELRWPAGRNDARKFYWISILLATVIVTLALEWALHSLYYHWWSDLAEKIWRWWHVWRTHLLSQSFDSDKLPWLDPAEAFLDRWWGVIPLGLGVFLANLACVAVYQWIVGCGGGPARMRFEARRLEGISLYSSALFVVLAALLGSAAWCFLGTMNDRVNVPDKVLLGAGFGALLLAAVIYSIATFGLVLRTGRRKLPRVMLMLLVYPPAGVVLWISVVTAVQWVVGFVVVAVASMAG